MQEEQQTSTTEGLEGSQTETDKEQSVEDKVAVLGNMFQILTDMSSCLANELQRLHWNVRGAQFDTMHKVLDKLYTEMNEDCDTLAEITGQYANGVAGRLRAADRVDAPEVDFDGSYVSAVNGINELLDVCLQNYVTAYNVLDTMKQCHISIGAANFLQTRLEFWSKEREYFNKHRGVTE